MKIQICIFFALMMGGVKTVPDRGNITYPKNRAYKKEKKKLIYACR